MAQGRYSALIVSQTRSFFANPHKAVTVNIEVISDSKFANQEKLMAIVINSFNQFRPLGINFRLESWRIKDIAPGTERTLTASGHSRYLMVLSNNRHIGMADHQWQGVAAFADPQKGQVVIGIKDKALLDSPKLGSTVQHELGHLFYAEHDIESTAFVMSPVENSSTAWSPEARNTILKMKYKF